MRVNMLEGTTIEEVTKIIKVAETKMMKEMSIQYLANPLCYSKQQVGLVFKIAAGQTTGQYLKRWYLAQVYLTVDSDAYNKLKRTAAVMGCGHYKQKMEHFSGKEVDDDKLQRPLTAEQMRVNLFDLESSLYIDRWLKEKIYGKRQWVDTGNDVTRLLLLDENNRMPYDYDHYYFRHKGRLFVTDSRSTVDTPYNNSLWTMGMEFCIYRTEQAENKYAFQIIKEFMENGTVKNMKRENGGIQVQKPSCLYAHKDKSSRIVNIINGSDMVGEALTTLMIKEEYIILESGKLFFLLDK